MANTKNTVKHNFDPALFQPVEPVKLFDDFFFVGNKVVGFFILKTTEGLILFEAMDKYDADDEFLVPGLKKLGFENEKILMLFITHGHFDHYMGADKVRIRTGCEVALSKEDASFMVWAVDNREQEEQRMPHITKFVEDGDVFTFGEHIIEVLSAPGHTPGCLNYSFEVSDLGQKHRIMFFGGYGVFGPGVYPGKNGYPYSVQWAVDHALLFAASCVKTWEYCKANNCDVYLNPHPHLCELFNLAEVNKNRKDGNPNAFVIGVEGVRKWILERYNVCVGHVLKFTDIAKEYNS